jgi:hypothetical protein
VSGICFKQLRFRKAQVLTPPTFNLRDLKRRSPRYAVSLSVLVEVQGVRVEGMAINVGMGGMFITGPHLAYGQQVEVIAELPGAAGTLRLPGVVRWTDEQGFGIQFLQLGAQATHSLSSLMAALAA